MGSYPDLWERMEVIIIVVPTTFNNPNCTNSGLSCCWYPLFFGLEANMWDPFAKLIFSWADGTWEMVGASHRAWLPKNDGFVMVCLPIENAHIWWLFMVDHHFSPLKCGPSLFGPFPRFEETLLICTWRNWGRIRSMSATRWRWNSCVGNMAAVHTLLLLSSRGLLGNSLLHWGLQNGRLRLNTCGTCGAGLMPVTQRSPNRNWSWNVCAKGWQKQF